MKPARGRIGGVAATVAAVAATAVATAVAVVMVAAAAGAVEAETAIAIVVPAATTANLAGKTSKKEKVKRQKYGWCVSINLYDLPFSFEPIWAFAFEPKPRRAFPLFPFYFLASGLIFKVIRWPPRISSTSYSSPAFISPSA